MKTIEILIIGKVQRVGFRACIRRTAANLNVGGTVANLPDGRVHVVATSEPMILEKFVSMLYGCPRAVIRDLQTKEVDLKIFEDFSIIRGDGN